VILVDYQVTCTTTHMCVTSTAEGAFLRGNRPTVVADASATRSRPGVDGPMAARDLHRAALATIGGLYAVVVPTAAELG
jgi:nicotinamidase-related amidase